METMAEMIEKRRSERTYQETKLEAETLAGVNDLLSSYTRGPFGNEVRFILLDLEQMEENEAKKLGTYGVIKGADLFIAGIVKEAEKAMEDFGYCMENVILRLTGMGLGTCWLAGTFKRKNFAQKIGLAEDELLPAVTPIGYIKDTRSWIERVMRFLAGARNRKPWEEMFFRGDFQTPLNKKMAGDYAPAVEAVRLGPSASNKQPWIILKEPDKNFFHFFLKRSGGYLVSGGKIEIQNIDMGIAMCHFENVAMESGKKGNWILSEAPPVAENNNIEYIATWQEI